MFPSFGSDLFDLILLFENNDVDSQSSRRKRTVKSLNQNKELLDSHVLTAVSFLRAKDHGRHALQLYV